MEIRPILSALRRHKTAAALIVLEIALSCAIVCNALFLVAQRVDELHRPSGIAEHELLTIGLGGVGKQADADARSREDLAALRSVPGVANATIVNQVPFQGGSWNSALSNTPDQEVPTLNLAQYYATPSTLQTMGLKLIAGRDFIADEFRDGSEFDDAPDMSGLRGSLIVSQAAAEKLFPEGGAQAAIGKTVYMANIPLTIVGVVERLIRPNGGNGEWNYSMIFPISLNYANGGFYLIRVSDPARRDEVLKNALATLEKIDPNRLVQFQQTYDDARNDFFASDRDMIGLLIAVSVLLLLVTALGIVGLASFWVAQRTRQIGVRRALGATRVQIQRYFQTENFLLATAGIVIGMLLAFAINQLLMGKYELPRLPWYYLPIGAAILWVLGQVSVLWPARRAAGIPPAIATRSA
ncbi:MAG: ABC transporter permease [Pseudoxanthomonas sp.]